MAIMPLGNPGVDLLDFGEPGPGLRFVLGDLLIERLEFLVGGPGLPECVLGRSG